MNRFLFRHPLLGVLALAGGFTGLIVLGGTLADRTPTAVVLVAAVVLLAMALVGTRT